MTGQKDMSTQISDLRKLSVVMFGDSVNEEKIVSERGKVIFRLRIGRN